MQGGKLGESGLSIRVTVLVTRWPLMGEHIFCISVHFGCKILGIESLAIGHFKLIFRFVSGTDSFGKDTKRG